MHRYRTGVAWRDLPERFGPWQTVWKRHHRFSTDGTWDKLVAVLQAEADAAGRLDWNVSVDSSVFRAHQHGATAKREDISSAPEHTGAASNYKISGAAGTNRAITPSVGLAADCQRRSTLPLMAVVGRWPFCSPRARPVTLR